MTAEKSDLRRQLRQTRKALQPVWGGRAGMRLMGQALPHLTVQDGAVVAGYWPVGSEMDPRPLMMALQDKGARLALPVVTAVGEALAFRAFDFTDQLAPGLMGTPEPTTNKAFLTPDILLVPLLGFDRQGLRLGQGGGYYDRTLESLRARHKVTAIGIAFAAQEVSTLPFLAHDQKLDAIVTEQGYIQI
ncbi:MAG: 5-formyltetrahydrofolate cyclo-ligase [Rhodospirillales bacterium]|nr:5-formyltetrahydrofolate cyclo-ligase [Rhodospirillales bacterium]